MTIDQGLRALDVAAWLSLLALAWSNHARRDRLALLGVAAAWSLGWFSPELITLQRGAVALLVVACGAPQLLRRPAHTAVTVLAALALSIPSLPAGAAALAFGALALGLRGASGPRVAAAQKAAWALAAVEAVVALMSALESAPDFAAALYVVCVPACCWLVAGPGAAARSVRGVAPDEADVAVDPFGAISGVLREALHDPGLDVHQAPEHGQPPSGGIVIRVRGAPWAVLRASPGVLADPATQAAAQQAVERIGVHSLLVADLRRRTADLASSRAALLDAVDRERAMLGPEVERAVLSRLDSAGLALAMWPELASELRSATNDIQSILAGYPPVPLGEGGLVEALGSLGARLPVRVDRDIDATFRADASVEAVIYAVAAEALTNAAKHAGATAVRLSLHREGSDWAVAHVEDDGRGGARPDGRGLAALRLRVEARHGQLDVDDVLQGGTAVHARIPLAPTTSQAVPR